MSRNKKKKLVFYSMTEFEKVFLPKSFNKRMLKKPTDAYALGSCLARESLDKIKERLAS